MRSNILIKRKSSKKRSDCEGYFKKFDSLNHFKRLLFSKIIKTFSFSLRILNIINKLNTLTFNIIKYEIKLSTTMWILNTFSRINKWLMILSKHFAETNSNNFVIWSTWNLAHRCIYLETSFISNELLLLWKLIDFHNSIILSIWNLAQNAFVLKTRLYRMNYYFCESLLVSHFDITRNRSALSAKPLTYHFSAPANVFY